MKHQARIQGARVITEQIQDRYAQRVKDGEIRARERE